MSIIHTLPLIEIVDEQVGSLFHHNRRILSHGHLTARKRRNIVGHPNGTAINVDGHIIGQRQHIVSGINREIHRHKAKRNIQSRHSNCAVRLLTLGGKDNPIGGRIILLSDPGTITDIEESILTANKFHFHCIWRIRNIDITKNHLFGAGIQGHLYFHILHIILRERENFICFIFVTLTITVFKAIQNGDNQCVIRHNHICGNGASTEVHNLEHLIYGTAILNMYLAIAGNIAPGVQHTTFLHRNGGIGTHFNVSVGSHRNTTVTV